MYLDFQSEVVKSIKYRRDTQDMDLNNNLLSNDTEYSLLVVLCLHGGRFRMLSGPELIKKKQKSLYILKTVSLGFLLFIPLAINFLNRIHFKPWQITICVAVMGSLILILHRIQTRHKTDIDRACHQLGPGVKLIGKFKKSRKIERENVKEKN